MKGMLRSVSALLLMVLLATFCLWRYEKIDTVTAYLSDAMARLDLLTTLTEQGAEPGGNPSGTPSAPSDPGSDYSDFNPTDAIDESLLLALRVGLEELQEEIDLTAVSPAPTKDAVKAAMASIIYSSPQFFYLNSAYSISSMSDGSVQSVKPTYTATKDEIATMRVTYEAALSEIVAGAPQNGTDFDKVLYLHDYFIKNYSYDDALVIRDAYNFFTQKKGVCQAYMLALIAAAERLGVESLPVTSDPMKHAWNLVKLGDAWYHVDLTWDDAKSLPTLVSYTYFLQSDAGLIAIDAAREEKDRHRSWTAAVGASDTTYDAAVFRGANTPIIKHNGIYYCTGKAENAASGVRGVIYAGENVAAMQQLREITGGYWLAQNGYYYTDCYAGLAVIGDHLYYHSGNSICRIALGNTADYHVHLVTDLAAGESIYGFLGVEDGKLSYLVARTLSANEYRIGVYSLTS